MKKATTAKKAGKKPAQKGAARASRKTSAGMNVKPLVAKQPVSKQQAAASQGVFLHPDDSWSTPYFDPDDLHFLERELFG